MSRLDELKKQYPELNMSVFDMMVNLDPTKSYKYMPLLCKLMGKRFNMKNQYGTEDLSRAMLEIEGNLINRGLSTNDLTENQIYTLHQFTDFWISDMFYTFKEFIDLMEKNQIDNNDVTSYQNIDELRGAITLASIKGFTKEMESQVVKEYEDATWLIVRPLTFAASSKYGATTRWCTTYQKEKHYFEKYWRRGILVYFINKVNGFKFAGYKCIDGDNEFSFWNAEDSRVDYLTLDVDDYLFPIVRKIFKSEYTNKNLCSDEIQEQVHGECIEQYTKVGLDQPREIVELREYVPHDNDEEMAPVINLNEVYDGIRELREVIEEMNVMEDRPVRISAQEPELLHSEFFIRESDPVMEPRA